MQLKRIGLYALSIIFIVGCASTPTSHHYSNNSKFVAYSAVGLASFYGHGDGYNGKRMANGQIFNAANPHLAAHPFLPLGTKLKVTALANNKTLYVEVCDRMGHVKGRIIDLSYGASKYLKMQHQGLTKVKINSVTDVEYKKHVAILD